MSTTNAPIARALMIQGTTSDAGKSILVAGLCRVMARRGTAVAPFKPQNMALNSAVTADNGEIGRAQALQAEAAGIEPHTDMNPVLLKPASDTRAQVIIAGKVAADMEAWDYHQYKTTAMAAVMDAWGRLTRRYEWVLIEGAGSPAEINLRDRDIANMGFAEAADVPVVIVADIDRGGVFAHLVGTLDLLAPGEQARVRGFVINRFRGDISLLQPGIDWLEARTGKPVFGVLPYLTNLQLDAEDAVEAQQQASSTDGLRVVVPVFPRISNHTDFDALRGHPQVDLHYVGPGRPLPKADLIVLPGSKNVRADLEALRQEGWDRALTRHLRYGGKVLGICGGYQMLGDTIADHLGIEDTPGESAGLGLLPLSTTLAPDKTLSRVTGRLRLADAPVQGYEIHCGRTEVGANTTPMVILEDGRHDGALSEDNLVAGCYLHGLFDNPQACAAILAWAGLETPVAFDRAALREQELNRLADCLEQHLDLAELLPGWGAA